MDFDFSVAYGDVHLSDANDFIALPEEQLKLQRIIQTLKTSEGDYAFLPEYGADIESYIGRGIDEELATDIQKTIQTALLAERINVIGIPFIIKGHTIHFRIKVEGFSASVPLDFVKDKGFVNERINY